ncbi:MAG: 6-phospho-beta-glucosidase [Clostridiales bacterium]|nr:6-phospho-beta-glucosidase [Clostridiales bacterium]
MKPIRIGIIGAGSSYTPELLDRMGQMRDTLQVSELRLSDIDADRLSIMEGFTRRFLSQIGLDVRVTGTLNRLEAIDGADFVVTQIRVGGNQARVNDEKIPLRYGLLGQETTGAGGFAKALRTIPVMLEIARDVERINPKAWIINYTNPTGIVAEAVTRYTGARFIALCGGGRHPANMLFKTYGIAHDRVRYEYFGLNHFNFSYNITVDGEPITEEQWRGIAQTCGVNPELTVRMKLLPSLYLPYFHNCRHKVKALKAAEKTRGEEVLAIEKELFAQYADPAVCVKPALLSRRGGGDYAEIALGVIRAIAYNDSTFAVCNVPNRGAVPFLSDSAVIETACLVDATGATPTVFTGFPESVRGLVSAVKSYESLTVEAAVEGSRDKALFALLAHPLIMDYDLALPMLEELLEVNRPYLPAFYQGRPV